MKELISSTESRRLDLIDLLMSTPNWVKQEYLAKKVNCSLKTLVNDFQFFKTNWSKYFILEFSKEKEVRLISRHGLKLKIIFADVLKSSITWQFYELLFFKPNHSIKYFCDQLFISEASLYRIIDRVNKLVKKIDVWIETKPLCSTGDSEVNVRIRTINYFDQAYLFNSWPFKKINYKKLAKIIIKFINLFSDAEVYDAKVNNLCVCLAVSLYRFHQGFKIDPQDLDFPDDDFDLKWLSFESELKKVADFSFPPSWYKDVTYVLMLRVRYWQQINGDEKNKIQEVLENFIFSCSKKIGFVAKKEDILKLIEEMEYVYVDVKLNFSLFLNTYENNNNQLARIKNKYPYFYQVVSSELKRLEEEYNIPCYSKFFDRVILTLYSRWEGLSEYLRSKLPKVKVFVISSKGEAHLNTLVATLDTFFGEKIKIEKNNLSYFDVDEEIADRRTKLSDIVVTNEYYPVIPIDRLFVVDDIPSNAQLRELGLLIENHQYRLIQGK